MCKLHDYIIDVATASVAYPGFFFGCPGNPPPPPPPLKPTLDTPLRLSKYVLIQDFFKIHFMYGLDYGKVTAKSDTSKPFGVKKKKS